MENYKQIKRDLDELRLLVEKSELWVYKAKPLEGKKKKKKDKDDKDDKESNKDNKKVSIFPLHFHVWMGVYLDSSPSLIHVWLKTVDKEYFLYFSTCTHVQVDKETNFLVIFFFFFLWFKLIRPSNSFFSF